MSMVLAGVYGAVSIPNWGVWGCPCSWLGVYGAVYVPGWEAYETIVLALLIIFVGMSATHGWDIYETVYGPDSDLYGVSYGPCWEVYGAFCDSMVLAGRCMGYLYS